jgi:hypothetical protein
MPRKTWHYTLKGEGVDESLETEDSYRGCFDGRSGVLSWWQGIRRTADDRYSCCPRKCRSIRRAGSVSPEPISPLPPKILYSAPPKVLHSAQILRSSRSPLYTSIWGAPQPRAAPRPLALSRAEPRFGGVLLLLRERSFLMPLFKFATIRLYFITDWTEMNHKRDSSKHAGSLNISIPATVFDLDANV